MTEQFDEDQFDGFVSSQPKNKYDCFNEIESEITQKTEIIQNTYSSQQQNTFQNYQQSQIYPNSTIEQNPNLLPELNQNHFAQKKEISNFLYFVNQTNSVQNTQPLQNLYEQYPQVINQGIVNNINQQEDDDEFQDGEMIELPVQHVQVEEQKVQTLDIIQPIVESNKLESQTHQNQLINQITQKNKYKDLFDELDFVEQKVQTEDVNVFNQNNNEIKSDKQIQNISLYDAFPQNDVSQLSIQNNPPSQLTITQQFESSKSINEFTTQFSQNNLNEKPPSSFNLIEMYQQKPLENVQSPILMNQIKQNEEFKQTTQPQQIMNLFDIDFSEQKENNNQIELLQQQFNNQNQQPIIEQNLNIFDVQNHEQIQVGNTQVQEQHKIENNQLQSYLEVLNNFQLQNNPDGIQNHINENTNINQENHQNVEEVQEDEEFDEFVEGEQIEQSTLDQQQLDIQQQNQVIQQQVIKQNLLPVFNEEKKNEQIIEQKQEIIVQSKQEQIVVQKQEQIFEQQKQQQIVQQKQEQKPLANLNFTELYSVQLTQKQEPIIQGPKKLTQITKRDWRNKIEDIVGFDAECLDSFILELDELKLNLYKSQVVEYSQLSRDIQALRKKKQIHVDKEEYEEATVIRDTLRAKEPIAMQLKKKILEIAKVMDLMDQQNLDYHIQKYVYEKENQIPENPTIELLLPKIQIDEEFINKLKKELKKSESVLSIIKLQGQLEKVRYEKKYQVFILGLRKIIGMGYRFTQLNEIIQSVNDRLSDLKLEREIVKIDNEYLFENTLIPYLKGQKECNNYCNYCYLSKPNLIEFKGKFFDVCCLNFYFNIN